jgi:type IV secretory pathway VirB10-like protein
MGFWKGLVDKVAQKKEELEDEAKKRAAKKAAEMAIDTGKAAAKAAVKNAGKTLDYAGKKLEEALFGEATPDEDAPPSSKPAKKGEAKGPDPFAKLKADEAARKVREKDEKAAVKAREEARAKTEREVDDELAALKKKIRGQ